MKKHDHPTTGRPLLVTRKQAAEMLGGVSIATIKRLEQAGVLRGKRLNGRSPTAQVFYAYQNVVAIAQPDERTNG
jgi:hypothetical protein